MKLPSFLRRRTRPLPVPMLLVDPRQCVQGLKHLGNLRLAERCRAVAVERCTLDDVKHRTSKHLVLRPLAK